MKPPTPPPTSPSSSPAITAPPGNVSAYLNDRVELKCGAKGDSVKISWRSRDLGEMPRVGHHYRDEFTLSLTPSQPVPRLEETDFGPVQI